MRVIFIAGLVGFVFIAANIVPSLAQPSQQITGKTCGELFRSCFRICAIHTGEVAYQGCEADCNTGQKSCLSTGTWRSKNATVKAEGATSATESENVSKWTRKEWNAAKAKWSIEKVKWANCRNQANDKKLSGRKSWSFLYDCMSN
jgi:hypothetical protein